MPMRVILSLLASLLLLTACGTGDDDGLRLAEQIAGTWYRGWQEGDVVIEGRDDVYPDNFSYDRFVFYDDGTYNGMVKKGSAETYDMFGDLIYAGTYECDNNNLRLTFTDEHGSRQVIHAQVLMFSPEVILLRYDSSDYGVTVTMKLYSSSSTSAE